MVTASDRVTAILYGSAEQGDLVADLGCGWSPEGKELLTSRAWVLLSARAGAVEQPLDAVFMNIADLDGLRRECELAKSLGYTGKAAIHPSQVTVINDVFTPSEAEVAHQRRIIELFDEALARGDGAVAIDGVMVDYASVRPGPRGDRARRGRRGLAPAWRRRVGPTRRPDPRPPRRTP